MIENMILFVFRAIAIPHELLHILGFKLVGKPYRYRWGDHFVEPADEMSRREHLIVALLPFAVTGTLALLMVVGLPLMAQVVELHPVWIGLYAVVSVGMMAYASFAIGDLQDAYRLLTGRDKTPFDPIIKLNDYITRPRESLTPLWVMIGIGLLLLLWSLLTPQS